MQKIPWSIITRIKNYSQILKGLPEQKYWVTIYWVHWISWNFTIYFSSLMDVTGTGKLHLTCTFLSTCLCSVLNTNLLKATYFKLNKTNFKLTCLSKDKYYLNKSLWFMEIPICLHVPALRVSMPLLVVSRKNFDVILYTGATHKKKSLL